MTPLRDELADPRVERHIRLDAQRLPAGGFQGLDKPRLEVNIAVAVNDAAAGRESAWIGKGNVRRTHSTNGSQYIVACTHGCCIVVESCVRRYHSPKLSAGGSGSSRCRPPTLRRLVTNARGNVRSNRRAQRPAAR